MPSSPSRRRLPSRHIVWIGDSAAAELAWARSALVDQATVRDLPPPSRQGTLPAWSRGGAGAGDIHSTAAPSPAVVALASDWPARFGFRDLVAIARRWPLAVIVSVATSLTEGRRRSGPPLPGVEEVPWNELPARVAWWFAELDEGRPGPLGVPGMARREDRVDLVARSTCHWRDARGTRPRVVVAAGRQDDLEGTAAAVTAAGGDVTLLVRGLPPVDAPADAVVWEQPRDDDWTTRLERLRILRRGCRVALVDSFPREETVLAATRAGAVAVLGRPLSLESLAGVLWGAAGPAEWAEGGRGG